MTYVQRKDGVIVCAFGLPQPGIAEEMLPDDHPEVVAFLAPKPPIDFSNTDNLEKGLKALGLVMAAWNGKTTAQLKSAFKTAWDSL